MTKDELQEFIQKQVVILNLALGNGLMGPDIRVDEVVAENAQATIDFLKKALAELDGSCCGDVVE